MNGGAFEVGCAPIPQAEMFYILQAGAVDLFAFKSTEVKAKALHFLKWFTSTEMTVDGQLIRASCLYFRYGN